MLFNIIAAYFVLFSPASLVWAEPPIQSGVPSEDSVGLPPAPPPPPHLETLLSFLPSSKGKSGSLIAYKINVQGSPTGSLFRDTPKVLPSQAANRYKDANKNMPATESKQVKIGKTTKESFLGQKGLKYGLALGALAKQLGEQDDITKAIAKFMKLLKNRSTKLDDIKDETLKALELDDELDTISDLKAVELLEKSHNLADPDIWVLRNKQHPYIMPMLKSLNYEHANKEYVREMAEVVQGVNGVLSSDALNELMDKIMKFAYAYIATIHSNVNPARKLGRGIRLREFLNLIGGKFDVFEDIVKTAQEYPEYSGLTRDLIEDVIQLPLSKSQISLSDLHKGVSKARDAIKSMKEISKSFEKSHESFAEKSNENTQVLEDDIKKLEKETDSLETLIKKWSTKLGDQSEDGQKISENFPQFIGNVQKLADKWLAAWDKVSKEGPTNSQSRGTSTRKTKQSFDLKEKAKAVVQEFKQKLMKSKENDETESSTQEPVVVEDEEEDARVEDFQPPQGPTVEEPEELYVAPVSRKIESVDVDERMVNVVRNEMATWESKAGKKLLKN